MTTSHPLIKRLAGALAVGALLVASLAGCLKMEMNLVLNEDRVDGSVIFAIDKEFLAFLDEFEEPGADGSAASDEFLDDLLNADLGELEGTSVEEYEDDTYIGSRYRFEQLPLTELLGSADELSITYDPGAQTYEVTGSFDMRDMDESGSDEELGLPPGMMQQMLESFDIMISITFPGEVQDHNGDLNGTTVTWRPVIGEENPIYALASSRPAPDGDSAAGGGVGGGSASTTVAVVVGLAVLVVGTAVGLGIWFLRRGRRPSEAAGAAAATDTAAAPPPPGPEL